MKLKRFDAEDFLDSDETLVEYLTVALEERTTRNILPKLLATSLAQRE